MAEKATPKYERPEDMPVDSPGMRFAEVEVGERLGPVEYRIKPSTHQKHCDLLSIHLPWFETHWNLFPWEMDCGARVVSRYRGRQNQDVEGFHKIEFYKPATVGQPVSGEVVTVDKYEKRGKYCVVGAAELRDDKGEIICRTLHEGITLAEQKGPVQRDQGEKHEETWHELGQLVKATKDLPEGFVLLTVTRGPCPMRVSGFAKGGWSKEQWKDNIHEDGYAKRMGYGGGLVEGPIAWEFALLESLTSFFGAESFFTTGRVFNKTCGPVYVGDVLVGKARIKEKVPENDGVRVVLDTRVERLDGTLVRIGTASAIVK
jgi:acyl dehydratase